MSYFLISRVELLDSTVFAGIKFPHHNSVCWIWESLTRRKQQQNRDSKIKWWKEQTVIWQWKFTSALQELLLFWWPTRAVRSEGNHWFQCFFLSCVLPLAPWSHTQTGKFLLHYTDMEIKHIHECCQGTRKLWNLKCHSGKRQKTGYLFFFSWHVVTTRPYSSGTGVSVWIYEPTLLVQKVPFVKFKSVQPWTELW